MSSNFSIKTFLSQLLFVLLVLTIVSVEAAAAQDDGTSNSANANANSVTINFDSLPTNITFPNQYQIASFSTDFQFGANVYTTYDGGLGSSPPNGIESVIKYYSNVYNQSLYVNFALPVNGLTFRVLNGTRPFDTSSTFPKCLVDVYVNNSYYTTVSVYQAGASGAPIFVSALSGISHITGLTINYYFNCESWYCNWEYPLIYDDFSFTPELSATIINPRVNGGLDGTTQKALVGADIVFQASTSQPNGTYLWEFEPASLVSVISGSANSSSITIRSTDIGNVNAKLTYTRAGVSVSPSVNINVIIPTLTNFTATQVSDQLNRGLFCSNAPSGVSVTYSLGCYRGAEDGIIWTATAEIPSATYLSDPSQSGIKFVQAVSAYRKRLRDGNTQCLTARTSPSNVASGWQLDTSDPYNHVPDHPVRYFSEGNNLTMSDFDAPATFLEGTSNGTFFSDDTVLVADQFQIYVFYFTTTATLTETRLNPYFNERSVCKARRFHSHNLRGNGAVKLYSIISALRHLYFTFGNLQLQRPDHGRRLAPTKLCRWLQTCPR